MYIRKSTRKYKGKTYTNYLLVESIHTPKGPRQRTICSLGNLAPAAAEEWLALAHRLESSLTGQLPLDGSDAKFNALLESARERGSRRRGPRPAAGTLVKVNTDLVGVEEAREAGPVHVGHHVGGAEKLGHFGGLGWTTELVELCAGLIERWEFRFCNEEQIRTYSPYHLVSSDHFGSYFFTSALPMPGRFCNCCSQF